MEAGATASRRNAWRGYAWAALAALAFSFEGVLAQGAFAHATTFAVMAIRFAMATLLVFCIPSAPTRTRRAGDRWILLATGFAGYAGTTALLFIAFGHIATSIAILLLYAYPAVVAIGSHVLRRERLTPIHAAALVLTFAGVAIVGGTLAGLELKGVIAALLAAFAMALTVLFQQPVLTRVSSVETARFSLLGATLFSGLLATATGQWVIPGTQGWIFIIGLAVSPTVVAVLALNRGVQLVGASRTSIVATLEPPFAALWGALWLGERFGLLQAIGAILVLLGVALVQGMPSASPEPRGSLGTFARDP